MAGSCCTPQCTGLCGGADDGCSGTCTAACPGAEVCFGTTCCTPVCTGATCGAQDGCGGTCSGSCTTGACLPGNVCPGGIAFDATSNSADTTASSLSWTHTITGINAVLFVSVAVRVLNAGPPPTVTGITYGSASLTQAVALCPACATTGLDDLEVWVLPAPPTGANTVSVSLSGTADGVSAVATSFTGVSQASPIDATGSGSGAGFIASLIWTPVASNTWALGVALDQDSNTMVFGPSTNAPQNSLWLNVGDVSDDEAQSGADQTGPGDAGADLFFWSTGGLSNIWVAVGASFE